MSKLLIIFSIITALLGPMPTGTYIAGEDEIGPMPTRTYITDEFVLYLSVWLSNE